MSVRTVSNLGGNWNTVGAWVEGAVPTAADEVVATATSGNLNITAAAVCRSLDLTGYTGVFTHGNYNLTIGDGTAPSTGIACKLVGTYTPSANAIFTFISSGAGVHIIDFNNKTLSSGGSHQLNGTASYRFDNGFTCYGFLVSAGTLDFNGQTVTMTYYIMTSSATAKTLIFGNSIIYTNSGINFTGTAPTIPNNTALIVITNANGATITCADGTNLNGASLKFVGSAGTFTFNNSITIDKFIINPVTTKTFSIAVGKTLTLTNLYCYPTGGQVTFTNGAISQASGIVNMYNVANCTTIMTGGATYNLRNNCDVSAANAAIYGLNILGGNSFVDYVNGSDTLFIAWGFYKVAYTGAVGVMPIIGEVIVGETSASTAKVSFVNEYEWSLGAGTMWFESKSAAFVAETIKNAAHDGHFNIAANFVWGSWKTLTTGAAEARIAPKDIVRIAKSPAPVKLSGATGQATWTSLSKVVTLAEAQTFTICQCENSNWTGQNDGTGAVVGVATDAKQGSYCQKVTMDAAVQINKLQAFWATGTLSGATLNGYQELTFWIKNSAIITNATTWYIALCSDVAGATPIDFFPIPAIPSTGRWIPLTIQRCDAAFTIVGNLGGNASTNVKSIAIYSGATAPANSSNVLLDNFEACTLNGLNLQSLISKNAFEQSSLSSVNRAEAWYGIQSIVGTAVLLDNDTNIKSNAGRGYHTLDISPETIDTYFRETIKTTMVSATSSAIQTINDSGDESIGRIEFQGGYDIITGTQIGETFYDGLNGYGTGLVASSKSLLVLNYLGIIRAYTCYSFTSSSLCTFNITNINNSNTGLYGITNFNNNIISIINCVNTVSDAVNINGSNNTINYLNNMANCIGRGLYFYNANSNHISGFAKLNNNGTAMRFENSSNNILYTIFTANNDLVAYHTNGENFIINATFSEELLLDGSIAHANSRLKINKLASTGYCYNYTDYGDIVSQAATAGGTGKEWKLSPTDAKRSINYPLDLFIRPIAVKAGSLVTVSMYFKKSHATDIGASLVVRTGQLAGVAPTPVDCPMDTNRNLLSISFTPSEDGVVEVEAWAYWLANTADENVIVDGTVTVTQA